MTRPVARFLAGLCLTVLSLGGCSKADDPGGTTDGTIGPTDLYHDPTGSAMLTSAPAASATSEPSPFDEFALDDQMANETISRVQGEFLAKCMLAAGFDYAIPEPGPSINPEDGYFLDQLWGVRSAQFARDYGYRNAPLPVSDSGSNDSDASDNLPDGYFDVLLGPEHDWANPDGCMGKLQARERQGQVLTPDEKQTLENEIYPQVDSIARASATMAEVSSNWSTCMSEHGYAYEDPTAAKADFMITTVLADGATDSIPKAKRATEQEKLVATADAECKDQTGFWAGWAEARGQAQAELVERYRPQLEQIKQDNTKYIENITALITELSL